VTSYDAVVIGGGVVGASTAWHLVHAGVKTLLVDRRDGGRATDAGAGILSTASTIRIRSSVSRRAPPRTTRS
jgi:D-amino-acid dehydrogenase